MTHSSLPTVGTVQPSLPNQPFFSWLRTQTTLLISQIAAALGLVYFLASLIYYVAGAGEHGGFLFTSKNVNAFMDYAHIVFITVFILGLIQVVDDNSRGSYRVSRVYRRVFESQSDARLERLRTSKNQLRRFKRRFLWFWYAMLALYVCFAIHHTFQPRGEVEPKGDHSSVAVSVTSEKSDQNASGQPVEVIEGSVEWKLSAAEPAPTTNGKADPVPNWRLVFNTLFFPFLEFFLNNISVLFVFWCFLIMYFRAPIVNGNTENLKRRWWKEPRWGEQWWHYFSGAMVAILGALYLGIAYLRRDTFTTSDLQAFSGVFDALSGALNAVVLALLIARLDSKLIGLPSWLISVLYSYAAVQPLFVAFEQDELKGVTTSVLVFVFISKVNFFLIIMYAMQTGRMLNYLFCSSTLRTRVDIAIASPPETDQAAEKKRFGDMKLMNSESDNRVMRYLDWLSDGLSRPTIVRVQSRLSESLRGDSPRRLTLFLGAIFIAFFIASLVLYPAIKGLPTPEYAFGLRTYLSHSTTFLWVARWGVGSAHLLIIGLLIFTLFLLRRDNGWGADTATTLADRIFGKKTKIRAARIRTAITQVRRFKEYFLWFWVALFLLHVILLAKVAQIHTGLLGALTSNEKIQITVSTLTIPFLSSLMGGLNLLFIFWCFVILQSPAYDVRSKIRQRRLVNYSSFVIGLLIAAFLILAAITAVRSPLDKLHSDLISYVTISDGLIGTLSAVALALLIARVDSKLVRLSSSLVPILFSYAAIQPLLVVFGLRAPVFEAITKVVLVAALGLKICFFLIIVHVLQSGRVLNYLVFFPILRERVDSIFENQFEIRTTREKAHSFTISILKKNTPIYSADGISKSRHGCDKRVNDLRKLARKRSRYQRCGPKAGTYWVEIRDEHGSLILESVPLTSKREVAGLIKESIEMIPHCKYNRT